MKKYSFWDAYVYADLVTYTSYWEGFGNQFLEAVYFKKLPVVFEYPVFEKDLKKEGYEYVSLGNKLRKRNGLFFVPKEKLESAVSQTVEILKDAKRLKTIVDKNFQIAKKYHDESLLEEDLRRVVGD